MTKMRAIIAQRMVESKRTSPHVHTVFKVDMTRIVKLREKEKNKYEQRNGVKLTYMPFITRAAIVALKKHPVVNAAIQGDAILYNKNINIGIAVALDWGLIVPVIKQTEEKNFLGIARAIVDVAERARGKKLAPDEISGGTFTLTNSGIFGEQFGTPIINQPQAAILGIGGLNKEAEVLTDKDGKTRSRFARSSASRWASITASSMARMRANSCRTSRRIWRTGPRISDKKKHFSKTARWTQSSSPYRRRLQGDHCWGYARAQTV